MSLTSRLKVAKIIGQRKPFHEKRIPESRCERKKALDIGIPVASAIAHGISETSSSSVWSVKWRTSGKV